MNKLDEFVTMSQYACNEISDRLYFSGQEINVQEFLRELGYHNVDLENDIAAYIEQLPPNVITEFKNGINAIHMARVYAMEISRYLSHNDEIKFINRLSEKIRGIKQ